MTRLPFGSITLSLATAGAIVMPTSLSAQKSRDRNVLTRAELLQSAQKSKDLYEAI